jgi:hypothetical protein
MIKFKVQCKYFPEVFLAMFYLINPGVYGMRGATEGNK